MRRLLLLPILFLGLGCAAPPPAPSEADVAAVLDALHRNASEANYEAYFALYTDDAVFLGTDASERWPIEDFKTYTAARFAEGTAWTYHMLDRHIEFGPDGKTAWFDETLTNENLGRTRGSGVLLLQDGAWRIAQYNLTILVPNDLARGFAAEIRAFEAGADGEDGSR